MAATAIIMISTAGCADSATPASQRVKKLDPEGTTWYIWGDGYKHPPIEAVPFTCATMGREVAEVTLADRYGSEGTVRCK